MQKLHKIQLRTFRFDSLDQISEAAKAAGDSCDDIHNALYKNHPPVSIIWY